MQNKEDQYYIEKVKSGGVDSFSVLVNRHKVNVYQLILKVLQNREDAEDIAQEVFIKVFKKLKAFKGEAKFSTYLYRVAYNTAISYKRKNMLSKASLNESILDSHITNDNEVTEKESHYELLNESIKQLDSESQVLLDLYYRKSLPIKELVQIMNLTEANIKVKLHRIRKKLQVFMEAKTIN